MRPSREETFFRVARAFASRGTCDRAQVGCVIVDGNHIVSHGYNGTPSGMPHCNHRAEVLPAPCQDAVHAEANAIAYAARVGVKLEGAHLFSTHQPCLGCAKMIIQSGIDRVCYQTIYRDPAGILLLEAAGLDLLHYL